MEEKETTTTEWRSMTTVPRVGTGARGPFSMCLKDVDTSQFDAEMVKMYTRLRCDLLTVVCHLASLAAHNLDLDLDLDNLDIKVFRAEEAAIVQALEHLLQTNATASQYDACFQFPLLCEVAKIPAVNSNSWSNLSCLQPFLGANKDVYGLTFSDRYRCKL